MILQIFLLFKDKFSAFIREIAATQKDNQHEYDKHNNNNKNSQNYVNSIITSGVIITLCNLIDSITVSEIPYICPESGGSRFVRICMLT
jgi:hypothetical protein